MKCAVKEDSELIRRLLLLHEMVGLAAVVIHPTQFDDTGLLTGIPLPWAVENMEPGRCAGTNPDWFAPMLEQTDLGFCLDLQHCFQGDRSLKNARIYREIFGDRLLQLHASAFSDAGHVTLHDRPEQSVILECIRDLEVPLVIESAVDTPAKLRAEYDFLSA